MNELVSVIVPTYNQADYLATCLDSVFFQDYENLELLLINDGSTDETADVIDAFAKAVDTERVSFASQYDEADDEILRSVHPRYPQHCRLRVIEHGANRGLAAALNTGVRAARGTYCTYIPSDNIAYPNMIAEMVEALEQQAADFVYSDMFIVDDAGRVLRRFSLPEYSFRACFADWYLCGVSKLYRTTLHSEHGYYREDLLAHDHELFQRFALCGARFSHLPRVLMGVRAHTGEREVDIHEPQSWSRLLEESKQLVLDARKILRAAEGSSGP